MFEMYICAFDNDETEGDSLKMKKTEMTTPRDKNLTFDKNVFF